MKEIFPEKYSVLLTGPPGVGKQYFSIDMAYHYLKKGEKVVILTTENSPDEIGKRAADIGLDLSSFKDSLYYLDSYSWSLRQSPAEKRSVKNVVRISSPESLNEIIVKVERIMGMFGGKIRLIVHSLSPLFLHNDDKDVIKFLQLLVTRVKEDESFILAALQEGVHSPSTVNTLRYLMDGALEMRFNEAEQLVRQIRAHHLKDLDLESRWKIFTIGRDGFIIQG